MNYYKRHIGDYAKKAGKLTMLQHGAYTLLLDACYDRERIPTLEEALEWSWATSQDEIDAVIFVHTKFFPKNETGQHTQKRVLEEILSYQSISETNKRIAIEREQKRKCTKRAQIVHEAPPNHKPITNNHKPDNKKVADAPVVMPEALDNLEFATAWQEYISYRSKSGFKALKRPSIQRSLNEMATWGCDSAIESLHNSIRNGWQGVFRQRTQANAFTAQKSSPSEFDDAF
jgi:uncharacterized protein YdaU (DUF1376 family)